MKQDDQLTPPTFSFVKKGTWGWKFALGYDIFMMILIIINLVCLSANALLMSDFGAGYLTSFICLNCCSFTALPYALGSSLPKAGLPVF